MSTAKVRKKSKSVTLKIGVTILALMFVVVLGPGLLNIDVSQATGGHKHWKAPKYCSETAVAAYIACQNEIEDDYWIAVGNCINLSDPDERKECKYGEEGAWTQRKEGKELCSEQRVARLEICEGLGQERYDPEIDPDEFVDFEAVLDGGAFTPNLYFPLVPGTVRKYRVTNGDDEVIERIKVEVLEETREILDVNCIVVRDRVWEIDEEGEETLVEDTFDWYAQDLAGNVWYFGEIARNYEDGELVDLEGSWQAGQDGAKAGNLMPINPEPADQYRQEFALGDAEDMGDVIDYLDPFAVRGILYGEPPDEKFLQTKDFTPIEPNVFEYKYYAPGVGVVLEAAYEDGEPTGERVELVTITP
jgi:hypothetical protein